MEVDDLAEFHGRSCPCEQHQQQRFYRQSVGGDALHAMAGSHRHGNPCERHSRHKGDNGARGPHQVGEIQVAEGYPDMGAVSAHVGGENLEQGNIAHRVNEAANCSERKRGRDLSCGAEFTSIGHSRESANLAAL